MDIRLFCSYIFFSLLCSGSCMSFAQQKGDVCLSDNSCWMFALCDEFPIARVSLPGAHDAGTGEGMYFFSYFGVTQELSLEEMWDSGVRAFDLRPAVQDGVLHIYHGYLKTEMSFNRALDIICRMLEQYPSEYAVVLLREELESENDKERKLWPSLVGRAIENLGEKAMIFHSRMTVSEARGKILFLSRNTYHGTDKGGILSGWTHSGSGNAFAKITSCHNSKASRLQVQDYYAPTNEEKRRVKQGVVFDFISRAESSPSDVWTINFLSGYSSTWLGFTPFATTSDYKANAGWLHPLVLEYLGNKDKGQNLGVVFMDFAGVDVVSKNLWHRENYEVCGKQLVNAIIRSNFHRN